MNLLAAIKVFGVPNVIFRVQREAPRDDKKRLRRNSTKKKREKGHQSKKKGPKRNPREPKERKDQRVAALWGRSGGPQVLPRDRQEHPRGAQKSPDTLSRPFSDRKPRFFKLQ